MHIKVRAKTGAKREELVLLPENRFEISLKAKPERNMANERIVSILSNYFSVPKNKIHIVKGHHSPSKIISVDVK